MAVSAVDITGTEPLLKRYASQITEERIRRLDGAMLDRLDAIQRMIVAREVNREEDTGAANPPSAFLAPLMPLLEAATPFLVSLGKRAESSFSFYHDDKCARCGLCEDVCLSGKVRLGDGGPVWQESVTCHGCFACLNYCPEESIQVASKWYLRSYTEENGRYHHPAVTANEIARQKTMEAS